MHAVSLTDFSHSRVVTLYLRSLMLNIFYFFSQWGKTKEARARVITEGLKNPMPDVSKAIVEAEADGKGRCSILITFHQ